MSNFWAYRDKIRQGDGDCNENLAKAYQYANEMLVNYMGKPALKNPYADLTQMTKARLSTELSRILGPGVSFEFTDNIPAGAPRFASVEEFQNSLRGATFEMNDSEGDSILRCKNFFILPLPIIGIEILTKTTMESSGIAKVTEVVSDQIGITLAWSWTQSSYAVSTSGDITTVKVYGTTRYNVYIENFASLLGTKKVFEIQFNNRTRKLLSFKLIEGSRYF